MDGIFVLHWARSDFRVASTTGNSPSINTRPTQIQRSALHASMWPETKCSVSFVMWFSRSPLTHPSFSKPWRLMCCFFLALSSHSGKDDKGFAMYIDRKRSWFQHNSMHERRVEGGISNGSTVGILLDLDRHTLSFLVNEMPQGSIAFRDLYGVFYPAVSINRGTTVTLHTAIDAPTIEYLK